MQHGKTRSPGLVAVLLVLLSGCHAAAAAIDPVQFIVYGDLPYSTAVDSVLVEGGRSDQLVFDADIRPAIHDHAADFVIHVGDLGRPETSCRDEDLLRHRAIWQGFGKPVVYTIGDNDWIDCVRTTVPGGPYPPLDRLARVRSLLFSDDALAAYQGSPPGWAIRHGAGGLRENTTWITANPSIAFIAVHIVSSCNGRDTFGRHPCALTADQATDDATRAVIDAAADRDQRNLSALREAYRAAEADHRTMLVIAMQADMFGAPADDARHPGDVWARCRSQNEFRSFCDVIPALAAGFSGDTLLIHGDTNAYCLEQLPMEADATAGAGAQPSHRFWRLNAPGDFKEIDAAVVTISTGDAGQATVTAAGLLSGQPAPPRCDRAQYTNLPKGVPARAYPRRQ